MFNLFKKSKELKNLANSFSRLANGITAIESDFQKGADRDNDKFFVELSILAVWAKDNILDVIKKNNFNMTEQKIRVPNIGGEVFIADAYYETIFKMQVLTKKVDDFDYIYDILEGKQAYFELKEFLKQNHEKLRG